MKDDTFSVNIDEATRLITIRLCGAEPGSHYAEKYMDAYAAIERPWTFVRLLDHRHFKGMMSYGDVLAMADQWRELTAGIDGMSRAAVLTRDSLAAARIHALRGLFPNVEMEVFSLQSDALTWLGVLEAA